MPAGASPATVSALHEAIVAAAGTAEIRDALTRIDIAPATMEPGAFRERIARETEAWGPIVAASGFKPDE